MILLSLPLLQALSIISAFPTDSEESQQVRLAMSGEQRRTLHLQLSREKRQRRQDASLNAQANCNFGAGLNVGSCGWENLENITGLRKELIFSCE